MALKGMEKQLAMVRNKCCVQTDEREGGRGRGEGRGDHRISEVHNALKLSLLVSLYIFADIDECSLNTDDCDTNANCVNTQGGFQCNCDDGFTGNGVQCTGERELSHMQER